MAIVASLFPAIIETKKKSEEQYYARLQQLYSLMVWMGIALAPPMTFLATPLVTLLFGVDYQDAGVVLAIHIWASVFVFLGVASSKWFIAEGRQILSLQRTVVGVVVNVFLNYQLISILGSVGGSCSNCFFTVYCCCNVGFGARRHTKDVFYENKGIQSIFLDRPSSLALILTTIN